MLDLEKAEEPEIKLPTSQKKQEKSRGKKNTCISASLTMIKALTMWITTNCEKFLKRWEHLTTCLLRNLFARQEATFRNGHETMDWFKI